MRDQLVNRGQAQFISRKAHRMIDYPYPVMLMAVTSTVGEGPARTVPMAIAASMSAYSAMTDDKFSPPGMRLISMKTHIALDLVHGALLAASPWLFGFHKQAWAPHVAFGLMEIFVAAMTDPEEDGRESRQHQQWIEQQDRAGDPDLSWTAREDLSIEEANLTPI